VTRPFFFVGVEIVFLNITFISTDPSSLLRCCQLFFWVTSGPVSGYPGYNVGRQKESRFHCNCMLSNLHTTHPLLIDLLLHRTSHSSLHFTCTNHYHSSFISFHCRSTRFVHPLRRHDSRSRVIYIYIIYSHQTFTSMDSWSTWCSCKSQLL